MNGFIPFLNNLFHITALAAGTLVTTIFKGYAATGVILLLAVATLVFCMHRFFKSR